MKRSRAFLALLLLCAVPALAQRWSPPPGSKAVLVNPFSSARASFTLDLGSGDPWLGLRWPNCGAPDMQTYADRYFGGNQDWFVAGWNPQGFANENAFLGAAAVSKEVCGGTICYVPLCLEVSDWNFTHARSCAAYKLTALDGCGGGTQPQPEEPPTGTRMPPDIVKYCREDYPEACKAYRGCERTSCPCYTRSDAWSSPGGAWVYYDPTRPECRPDQQLTPPPLPEPEPPVGPNGRTLRCQQALNELEAAVRSVEAQFALVDRMCEAP